MPDVRHPLFARLFARAAPRMEAQGVAAHRRELLEGVGGREVEVGAGTGACFAHYPGTVAEVVAVEPEPYLRARALDAAAAAPVPVTVVAATAEALPFEDGSFDVGVASLVLCSVRDPDAALAELRRVLRPGAELRVYEHVRGHGGLARVQRVLDAAWPRVAGGCHLARDTPAAIARAGFAVERCRAFRFRPSLLAWPAQPHVIGVARR
jgi:ubiquinone/menaquinone biosynthesis C-methylase UbiE